ncbi:hypothetical protein diail_8053, partial [Diaporthe ilicicola]
MSHNLLWRAYYDDNVDKFRRLLAPAAYNAQSASKSPSIGTGGAASPGAFGTSPRNATKPRKASALGPGAGGARSGNTNFGRAEVNSRDHVGLTLLLRAASSDSENAIAFVQALLDHPAVDIYVQDPESGWNALHRALYKGNVSIARLLLDKERRDLLAVGASVAKVGRLIKTKDNEGNSPFDLYNSTIGERNLKGPGDANYSDDESESEELAVATEKVGNRGLLDLVNGTEVFAFGSNKNLSLGLGDEDDRQFPERVYLERPGHLIERFYEEYLERGGAETPDQIPTLTRHKELLVHDVVLSKYHSAILTSDPVSNLYICGIGRGGRLGLGDENTRFTYTPVQGGLTNKKVTQVALGQNHTLAVTSEGGLYSWGSNINSTLGYALPEPPPGEEPMSLLPRQLFGPLKKELIVGVAASTIHSVAFTSTGSLYCWGRNTGQLALMDADSRSLEVQQTPRKVAASLLNSGILMVSAIDKATTCLLANYTVVVFTSYGYNVVKFPFAEGGFTNYHLGNISMSSRYDAERNQIKYIASGGETIVGVSGRGDLFSMNLTKRADTQLSMSTTNPSKIKGAVSQPICIWNAHKDGVRSVDVGEHGSVIISTQSGAVWRRIIRAKAKDTHVAGSSEVKRKDFKFQRVPGITNIVTVRSSIFGAFAAVRKDPEVMREQVTIGRPTLWDDIAPLNCLREFLSSDPGPKGKGILKTWDATTLQQQLGSIAYEVLKSPNLEMDLQNFLLSWRSGNDASQSAMDTVVRSSSLPEVQIPAHSWILCARSPTLRQALGSFRSSGTCNPSDVFIVEKFDEKIAITFAGLDLISLLNLVVYVYEDRVIPAWNYTRHDPSLAYRYRQIRAEVVKTASNLEMGKLEAAAQKQVDPKSHLDEDLRLALKDPQFFEDADALLELDGDEVLAHSALLCQRCPFFEGLFYGRSQGMWLAGRRAAQGPLERVPVDLKHIDPETFKFVLSYLYSDTGDEMFDGVITDNLDEFSDLVMDVLSVANELMLDRLSQICQQVLSRFINTRNIAHFLNAISPCSITEFKDAGLEYIALQLENMLENNLLADLDEELLLDLDQVVRDNQLARFPFARSGRAALLLHEQYPNLAQDIDEERQRRVREMAFKASQKEDERKLSSSLKGKFGSLEDLHPVSPALDKSKGKAAVRRNEPFSPDLRPKAAQADLIFDMDEDEGPLESPSIRPERTMDQRRNNELDQILPLSESLRGQQSRIARHSPLGSSPAGLGLTSPSPTGQSLTTPSLKSGNPWVSSKLPTTKLDLREIMNETPPVRSALSAGLAAQQAKEASAKPSQTKMSQKERKRQQQLQAEQAVQVAQASSDKAAWEKSSADVKSPPWKMASSAPKIPFKDNLADSPKSAPPNTKPLVAAEASVKSIPRRTQSPDTRHSGQPRTPTTTPPVLPPARATSTSTFSADMSSKPVTPHSKSYIKPATKSEPIIGLSMADIIDEERRNLQTVKEAVAKRSLMEIQQEQAFQEWWEEESRRTQEEEARRSTREKEREDGKNSKGRRGRSGKPRGGRGGVASGVNPGAGAAGAEGEAARPQNPGRGHRR